MKINKEDVNEGKVLFVIVIIFVCIGISLSAAQLSESVKLILFVMIVYKVILLLIYIFKKILRPIKNIKKIKNEGYDYYREELIEYSPMINAILVGKSIYNKDVIVSMYMYLEEKKENLLPHEKFFYENRDKILFDIKNNQLSKYEDTTLTWKMLDLVEEDLLQLNLITENYVGNKGYTGFVNAIPLFMMILNVIYLVLIAKCITDNLINYDMILLLIEIVPFIIWVSVWSVSILNNFEVIQYLTDIGIDQQVKLRAYKRFLKHFTIIGDRTIKEKKLLYSHIRNAIFLNLVGKLDTEANNYYKDILKKLDYEKDSNKIVKNFMLVFNSLILPMIFLVILMLWGSKIPMVVTFILFEILFAPFIFGLFESIKNPKINKKDVEKMVR